MLKPKWQAIPDSAQEIAVDTRADQTLYAGTRWCGKTQAQLMCFRSYVGIGYGAHWRGVIFDVAYKPLAELVAQGKELFLGNGDGCVWRAANSAYYFEWITGERLYLRACKNADDAENYKGHGYSFVGFNELSKWGTSEVLDIMLATMRGKPPIKDMPRMVFMTTNPDGKGASWIRHRYVDVAPAGTLIPEEITVNMGNVDGDVTVTKTKICLVGSYIENKHLTPADLANLKQSVKHNPILEAAWMRCDWDACNADGAIGSIWDRSIHIIPDFKIPSNWKLNRAFDWGNREPFAIGWFAESNGEEFIYKGETLSYPAGSVIMFYEWYGSERIGANRGLGLTPSQIAHGILTREHDFVPKGILHANHKVYPGPADNQIDNVIRSDVETIKTTMAKCGVRWTKSDKSPGTRTQGLQILRQYLGNALTNDGKGFYVMRKCRATIRTLPSLQADGEDIANDQEDHLYDMIRYRLLTRKLGKPSVNISIR